MNAIGTKKIHTITMTTSSRILYTGSEISTQKSFFRKVATIPTISMTAMDADMTLYHI